MAYVGEFGLETEDQSCLHLVDFITTEMDQPFRIFGESDEAFRIKGGSSALIKALTAALENKADMRLGYALTALDRKGGKIVMTFAAPDGTQSESFDAVILTLPFTKLRDVKGLKRLKLAPEKMKCIRELGYGTSAKILNGTTSRVWRSADSGLPAPSNGNFYPDLGFQNLWEDEPQRSRAKPASSPISWAAKPASPRRMPRSRPSAPGLAKMSPKMAESLDTPAVASFFWGRYPFTLGSYCQRQARPIHDDAGRGRRARSRRPGAIRRRAYQRRLPRLHERGRPERKPGRAALIETLALKE